MLLKLLTDHERRTFAAIPSDTDEPILRRYFVLRHEDESLIRQARGPHNKLGLAHQLGWLRWLGFQPEAEQLPQKPAEIGRFLAALLNFSADDLLVYGRELDLWLNHQQLAREHLKWRD